MLKKKKQNNALVESNIKFLFFENTVDSPYLQVIFVRENIAIKRLARVPESSIQTGSLTELQMQTIVLFYW